MAAMMTLVLNGCKTSSFTVKTPQGFAVYDREVKIFKAISPDGVRLRAYSRYNEPFGDESMWGETVKTHMISKGYRLVQEKEITAKNNLKGRLFEYSLWFNGEDYRYVITLFVHDKLVYIIETGGPSVYYEKRRSAVMSAIEDFSIHSD